MILDKVSEEYIRSLTHEELINKILDVFKLDNIEDRSYIINVFNGLDYYNLYFGE